MTLTLKQLAVICSPNGKGAEAEFDLWAGMRAAEYFPAPDGSAFYELALRRKTARTEDDVERVDRELRDGLRSLRRVWQFAGGARMAIGTGGIVLT